MNEILELFKDQIIKTLPSGAKDIEYKKFDYQMKTIYFKYKIGMKREKGSIQLTIKT